MCIAQYWDIEDAASAISFIVILSYGGYVFLMNYNSELRYDFGHYVGSGTLPILCNRAFFALMVDSFLEIRPLFLKRTTLSLALILYFAGVLGTFIFKMFRRIYFL